MSAVSKRTGGLAISYAIDSASEDEADISVATMMMPTPDSGVENIAPGKKRAGRPKATAKSSAIKAPAKAPVRASARRASGGAIIGNIKARAGRKPLTEISNPQDASDTEEVDEFEIPAEPKADAPRQMNTPVTAMKPPAKKRGPAKGKANETKQKGAKGNPAVAPTSEMGEIPETQEDVTVQSKLARTQSAAAKRLRVAKREVVPETQPWTWTNQKLRPTRRIRSMTRHHGQSAGLPIALYLHQDNVKHQFDMEGEVVHLILKEEATTRHYGASSMT